MTGYGKSTAVVKGKKIHVEVKSLNSKQLDLAIRLPQPYREIELELRNMVAKSLERGKVDLYLYTEANCDSGTAAFNTSALKTYKEQIQQLSQALEIPEPQDWITTLLSVFGGMMASLGMGIILSFLLKKKYHIVIFLAGFILVTYFGLSTMAVAVVAVITAVLYFVAYDRVKVEA